MTISSNDPFSIPHNLASDSDRNQPHESIFQRYRNRLISLCADWWLIELLSWSLAVLCIVTAIGVLASYDGKPLPTHPPFGLSLNACLSVLSAVSKLALAIPLEEALGSQKYLWFSSKNVRRPLMDFERFDDAARGPLGALKLLHRTRIRYVPCLTKNISTNVIRAHGRPLVASFACCPWP
jgi:hypothetical protein